MKPEEITNETMPTAVNEIRKIEDALQALYWKRHEHLGNTSFGTIEDQMEYAVHIGGIAHAVTLLRRARNCLPKDLERRGG